MSYKDHFRLADDLITHLDPILVTLHDPFIESRYAGFIAVSSSAVLELATRSIFCDFGLSKHKVLGALAASSFYRINAKIKTEDLHNYALRFGSKYAEKFKKELRLLDESAIKNRGFSPKASYNSLLVCRHEFAHQGTIPANSSYAEMKQGYESGKEIMHCLAKCMNR